MKLEIDTNKIPLTTSFNKINIGEVIRFEGHLYIKTEIINTNEIHCGAGINLLTGETKYFFPKDVVITGKLNLSWEDDYYGDS